MTTIDNYHYKKVEVGSIEAWTQTKQEIAVISQKFGLKLNQEMRRKENRLRQELAILVQSQSTGREVLDLRRELESIHKQQTAGTQIRSKMQEGIVADIIEYKKKENRRGIINRVEEVKTDGEVHEEGAILNQVGRFYQALYTKEEVDPEATSELLESISTTLTDTDNTHLESFIQETEVTKAIKDSNSNKSPGPDGLTYEFYKTFEDQLSEILTELYNNIHLRGRMEDGMRESYIRMLHKKGDRSELKNWRPISLSNTDYKIMSKVLTTRLNKVLPKLINEDQVGGISGRAIQRHLYLLHDLNRDDQLSRSRYNLIGIDMQKAFDRIDHRYVMQVVKKLGFSENMIKWFKIIQTGLTAKVIVNGKLTEGINIERGIRQGCSFSMATFILALEPLLSKIRSNPKIPGITLPGYGSINTIAYADDMTIVTKHISGIDETIKTINVYERASGSRINRDKCEIYPLNRYNPYTGKYKDITTDKIKLLGITYSKQNMQTLNWEPILRKAQTDINILVTKPTPLYIKTKLINTLILPKFYYVARIVGICAKYAMKIKKMLYRYLNGGRNELPTETIYTPMQNGGLGVHDIELRTLTLEVDRLVEAVKHPSEKWTYFLKKYLPVITNKLLNIRVNTNVSLIIPKQYLRIKKTYNQIEHKMPGSWHNKTVKINYDIMIRERKIKKLRNVIATKNLPLSLQNVWDPKLAYLYFNMNFKIFHGVYYGGITWKNSGDCPMCSRRFDTAEHLFNRCNATYELRQELTARLGIQADGATMWQTILMTYDNKYNKTYTYFRHVALKLRLKGKHARYNAKLAFIHMLDNDKDVT